LNYKLSRH